MTLLFSLLKIFSYIPTCFDLKEEFEDTKKSKKDRQQNGLK